MFTFIIKNVDNVNVYSVLKSFNIHRNSIPLFLKNKLLKKYLENLSQDEKGISIHVHRKKARDFSEMGKVDEKGEYTVFG